MNRTLVVGRTSIFGLLAMATLPGGSAVTVQPHAPAAKYTLKPVYQAGRIDRYKLELHVTNADDTKKDDVKAPDTKKDDAKKDDEHFDLRAHAVLRETIKKVGWNGAALMEDYVEQLDSALNGMKFEGDTGEAATQVKGWTTTHVCDRNGCVRDTRTKYNGDGRFDPQGSIERAFAPDGNLAMQILSPLFPAHPVQNGETWKVRFGPGTATPPTMTCTLIGRERRDGRDTYRVKMAAEVRDKQNGDAFYQATGNIDAATGRYLRLESTLTGGPLHTAKATLIMTLMR